MKAILKVKKGSSYARYNGLTFNVNSIIGTQLLNLQMDGYTADFSIYELLIVDVQHELQLAYDEINWGYQQSVKKLDMLRRYTIENSINVSDPIFNHIN